MKKTEVIPRIRINGIFYTFDEIPAEKVEEIVQKRIDLGLSGINYIKKIPDSGRRG